MKIALEISSLAYSLSGIQVYIRNFMESLLKIDAANDYLLTAKIQKFSKLKTYKVTPFWFRRFDVFHGFDGFIPNAIFATLRSAVIYDVIFLKNHNFNSPEERKRMIKKINRVLKRADILIVPSADTKRELSGLFRPERIFVIYGGCSPRFAPLPDGKIKSFRQKYNLGRFIIFVGVITARKNISGLIKAFRIIREKIPGIKLVIAGNHSGFGSAPLHKMMDDLQNDLILLKGVSEEELVLLYNSAELFIFPSFAEGFGLPVLEAMSCGTPVVISGISALPEVGGDAAVYCDPCNPDDIALKALSVLNDADKKDELRKRGLKRAAEFSWEKSAQKLLEIWEKNLMR